MKIQKIEKLTDHHWLNLFAATYEHDGRTGRWEFVSRKPDPGAGGDGFDAVVMVPLLVGGEPRLVVEREFRIPIGDYVYGFPAGLLEPGESVEETIRPELYEEPGYELVRIKHVSPRIYSSTGLTDESAVLAYIDVRATPDSVQHLEGSELIEVLLLDYAGVCELCENRAVHIDSKLW